MTTREGWIIQDYSEENLELLEQFEKFEQAEELHQDAPLSCSPPFEITKEPYVSIFVHKRFSPPNWEKKLRKLHTNLCAFSGVKGLKC